MPVIGGFSEYRGRRGRADLPVWAMLEREGWGEVGEGRVWFMAEDGVLVERAMDGSAPRQKDPPVREAGGLAG